MLFALVLQLASVLQDSIPYKPNEEFAVKFVFSFNKRGEANRDDLVLSQVASSTYDRPDNSPLPYVQVNLQLLKKPDTEVKLKVIRDHDTQLIKKKITPDMTMIVFSGFVDDIKDQISGYNHTIYFLDKEGKSLSKIVIEFDQEGFYSINGQKKGKL